MSSTTKIETFLAQTFTTIKDENIPLSTLLALEEKVCEWTRKESLESLFLFFKANAFPRVVHHIGTCLNKSPEKRCELLFNMSLITILKNSNSSSTSPLRISELDECTQQLKELTSQFPEVEKNADDLLAKTEKDHSKILQLMKNTNSNTSMIQELKEEEKL